MNFYYIVNEFRIWLKIFGRKGESKVEVEQQKNYIFDWIKGILLTLVLFYVIRYFLFIPIIVEGDSMMPTLENADRVIVNKIGPHITSFDRFDVVVFKVDDIRYVKRIIGLPGDTISYEDDELYINGEKVDEPFIQEVKNNMHKYGKVTYDFTLKDILGAAKVPKDHYFVLGDNRLHSLDSRDKRVGFVKEEDLIGCVEFIMYPFNRLRVVK